MIETKTYHLDKHEYAKIVIAKRFKKTWWVYLAILVLALTRLELFGNNKADTFFISFAFAYPFLVTIWLYVWATSKKRSLVFKQTQLKFDDSNFYFQKDGNETKIPRKNIKKIATRKDSWLLYISHDQFIYIPKNIFYSDNDLHSFSKLLDGNS